MNVKFRRTEVYIGQMLDKCLTECSNDFNAI